MFVGLRRQDRGQFRRFRLRFTYLPAKFHDHPSQKPGFGE